MNIFERALWANELWGGIEFESDSYLSSIGDELIACFNDWQVSDRDGYGNFYDLFVNGLALLLNKTYSVSRIINTVDTSLLIDVSVFYNHYSIPVYNRIVIFPYSREIKELKSVLLIPLHYLEIGELS